MLKSTGIYRRQPLEVKDQQGGQEFIVYYHHWYYFINEDEVYKCLMRTDHKDYTITKGNVLNRSNLCLYLIHNSELYIITPKDSGYQRLIEFNIESKNEFSDDSGKLVFELLPQE
ncbi:MAG: hypothetical protein KA953_09095 [Lachnospiraceae bacterium]|nr:hypothetical protein [Lachnospiraceae bacterium]